MEILSAFAPFLVSLTIGLILPPIVTLGVQPRWSGLMKFAVAFLQALLLGAAISFLAGQLASWPLQGASLMALLINTSLVFTASQLAYRFFWKPLGDLWRLRGRRPATERIGRRTH